MVGMSKSGSRYGRRSNWFKIHCLLQEQSNQVQTRMKAPKPPYEKGFGSPLDVVNNNNNNNNNVTSNNNNSIMNSSSYHERLPKRDMIDLSRTPQDLMRQSETSHILRPESSRFPIWRGPPFFHPALTHMQLLNAPFFPFQQRFMVPYVGQMSPPPQQVTSMLSSSSSESLSPRSTPSPKAAEDLVAGTVSVSVSGGELSLDKSVAFLRSLGPEQEAPIDLSMKSGPGSGSEPEAVTSDDDKSTDSDEAEDDNGGNETVPPLDLTRKT